MFAAAGFEEAKAQEAGLTRVLAISESDGSPLAGANVLLYREGTRAENGHPHFFCVTDRDGLCEMRNVPAGKTFELAVSFIGHRTFFK